MGILKQLISCIQLQKTSLETFYKIKIIQNCYQQRSQKLTPVFYHLFTIFKKFKLFKYIILIFIIQLQMNISQQSSKNDSMNQSSGTYEENSIEYIKQQIMKKSFANINLKDKTVLDIFLEFVEKLPEQAQSLKIIKNLLGGYGIIIMPFLKNFYDSLSESFEEQFSKQFKILAAYAQKFCNQQQLPELKYFYKKGIAQKKINANLKNSETIFIQNIKIVSNFYSNRIIETSDEQRFNLKRKQFIRKYDSNIFYQQSLLKFEDISKKAHKRDQSTCQSMIEQNDTRYETKLPGNSDSDSELEQCDSNLSQSEIYNKPLNKQKIQQQMPKQENNQLKQQYNTADSQPKPDISFSVGEESMMNQSSFMDETIVNQVFQVPQKFQQQKQQHNLNRANMQNSFNKQMPIMKKNDVEKTEFLCCKRFFSEGQIIRQSDNTRIALINPKYPFKGTDIINLKNIICSLLNTEGGIIYIGIEKTFTGKKTVVGGDYSEAKKEAVLISFRQMAQTIEPDIITHKMYNIFFVPVRVKFPPYDYIPGRYVIKCEVRYGIRDEIYSYNDNSTDRFVFRNQGQIFIKEGRALLKTFRQRILNPLPIPDPEHEGICQKPEIGEQTHQYSAQTSYERANEKGAFIARVGTQKARNPHRNFEQQIKKPSKQVNFLSKQMTTYSQQFSNTNKQPLTNYFFVVGCNENQLVPVFEKKGLAQYLRIQSTKSKKLVVRVQEEEYATKVQKILKKLSEKYRQIIFYKMSLELRVTSTKEAFKVLEKKTEKFSIKSNNILKYRFYKDSLEGFILLQEAKLPVQFVL